MNRWDEENPGAGVMRGPLGFAAALRGHEDALTQVAAGVEAVRGTLGPQTWTGEAATAWRGQAGLSAERTRALVEMVRPVHAALKEYADAVVALQAQVSFQRQAREDAERTRHAMGWFDPGASPAVEARRAMLADQAEMDQHVAGAALHELAVQRQGLDDRLVAVLAIPGASGWAQRKEVLSRAGITSVDALDTARLVEAYTRFTDQALDGDLKTGDVTYLQDFFTVWGKDSAVMDAYFRSLGGERTRGLVDTLGRAMEGMNNDIVDSALLATTALAVRSGLSIGSQSWTVEQAESFVDGLLHEASPVVGGALSAAGWIFGDTRSAPMGPALAVAAADRLDSWERAPQRTGLGALVDLSAISGGRFLSWRDHPGREGLARSDDPMGRVFETLGLYPQEAMAWLTPEKDEDIDWGRLDYWFGSRDWSTKTTGDGFAGPTALWAGALQIEGGRTAQAPDLEVEQHAAALTTRAMEALATNKSFGTVGVDDLAAQNLLEVIEVHIRDFAMYPITHEAESASRERGFRDLVLFSDGSYHAVPAFSDVALGKIMGVVGNHEATETEFGTLLTGEVTRYVTDAAEGRGPGLVDVATHVTSIEGFAIGSSNGAGYLRAAFEDERTQAVIDKASSIAGLAPVKGGVGVEYVYGEIVTALGKKAAATWANTRAAAGVTGDVSIESMLVDQRADVSDLLGMLVATGHHDQEWETAVDRHVAAGKPPAEAEQLAMNDLVDAAINAGRAGAASGTPDHRD